MYNRCAYIRATEGGSACVGLHVPIQSPSQSAITLQSFSNRCDRSRRLVVPMVSPPEIKLHSDRQCLHHLTKV